MENGMTDATDPTRKKYAVDIWADSSSKKDPDITIYSDVKKDVITKARYTLSAFPKG